MREALYAIGLLLTGALMGLLAGVDLMHPPAFWSYDEALRCEALHTPSYEEHTR